MAHVQSAIASGVGTSISVAFPSNNTAGNLLIVAGCARSDITSVTDSRNTWTKATDTQDTFGPTTYGDIWYTANCGAGANTVNLISGTSDSKSVICAEYSGMATSSVLDKIATGTDFSNNGLTGSTATTTQADELLVAMIGNEGAGRTITWLDSYTERQDGGSQTSISLADKTVAATGAYTASGTVSGASSVWVCCLATFKLVTVPITLDQEGYRWRNDDGTEATATWKAAQDTTVSLAPSDVARLRMLVNASGDTASKRYALQYRKVGDPSWRDVDTFE